MTGLVQADGKSFSCEVLRTVVTCLALSSFLKTGLVAVYSHRIKFSL